MATAAAADKARRIARYCLSGKAEKLPDSVVHEVKRRVLDSVATAMGAWKTPVAPAAVGVAKAVAPTKEPAAEVIGLPAGSLLEYAAFANGALVRALDFNDTYLAKEPAHPSDNIAAVIAAAQVGRKSGLETILAIANAYEIQCRLCDAHSLRSKGIDHVVYGNISVAASVGALLGLDEDKVVDAIGIAGVAHTAIRQTREGLMANWKAAAFANAARNGLFAVRAAQAGFTGPSPIFEGVKGIEKVLCGEFDLHLDRNGAPPRMILKTYIKPFPVEYHAQTAVEAALELRARGVDWKQVAKIRIGTHRAAYEIIGRSPEKWDPQSRETADHSLPYCAAIALIEGPVNEHSFDEKKYRNKAILDFLKKIEVVEDIDYTADYGNSFANHLEVTMQDGTVYEAEKHHPLGHPKNAMTDAQIEDKFRELAEGVLPRAEQNKFLKRVWAMESLAKMKPFYPKVTRRPG